jgi:hypothetical protein
MAFLAFVFFRVVRGSLALSKMVGLSARSVQKLTVGVVQTCNDVADLAKLSRREKLRLLEAIWEDLLARVDAMEVPREHRQILDERIVIAINSRSMDAEFSTIYSAPPSLCGRPDFFLPFAPERGGLDCDRSVTIKRTKSID